MGTDPFVQLAHLENTLSDVLQDTIKLANTLTELLECLRQMEGDEGPGPRTLETAEALESAVSILLWAESRTRSYCELTERPKPIILGKVRKIRDRLAARVTALNLSGETPF